MISSGFISSSSVIMCCILILFLVGRMLEFSCEFSVLRVPINENRRLELRSFLTYRFLTLKSDRNYPRFWTYDVHRQRAELWLLSEK
ncbi:unnamed protein product [Trifolium pratense]|uniref:Uncharacterized protein n=1 Tax=Trifolium pratense TaxID=57577 RepID=A0ACB0KM41_TRIPR|nr:unnamed protein product [Trifolium pratense]